MRFFLAGLFILAGGLGIAEAQTSVDGIKGIERGYMEITDAKTINDSLISTGQRSEAAATLTKSASRIELAENTVFGFFFVLDGQPRNASVKIRVIWRYPDPGIKSGDKMKFSDEYDADVLLNNKQWLYWNTAGIWNEVPTGIWTCELWYGERRITRQDFEVVRN